MPDGDVIRRGVRYAWRAAYEGLSAAGSHADVRGLVAKGLTASLRKQGIPPYERAASLIADVWNGRISQLDGLAQAASTVGSVGGTRSAALLETATRRAIVDGPTGARPDQAVVEAYLNASVEAELMAKVRPAMLENGEREPATIDETIARWIEEAQEPIRRIAQQLVDDPNGRSLRAPTSRRGARKKTSDMLDEAL